MKRLIIHPKDRSTDFLKLIYEGWVDVEMHREHMSGAEMNRVLHHTPLSTQILLLGHGSDAGLFYRNDDTMPEFDGVEVGHPHCFHLRKRRNVVGVFCNADRFAEKEGLHGLFSGMVISEMAEATEYGVETTQEELDRENVRLAKVLHELMDIDQGLSHIPAVLKSALEMYDESQLVRFNYSRFRWM